MLTPIYREGLVVDRVVAGQMVDSRILMDGLGMMTQIGVISSEKAVTWPKEWSSEGARLLVVAIAAAWRSRTVGRRLFRRRSDAPEFDSGAFHDLNLSQNDKVKA
jgi:hypothetical protein